MNQQEIVTYFMKQKLQVQHNRVDTGFPFFPTFDKALEFRFQIDVAITVTAFSALFFFQFSIEVVVFFLDATKEHSIKEM